MYILILTLGLTILTNIFIFVKFTENIKISLQKAVPNSFVYLAIEYLEMGMLTESALYGIDSIVPVGKKSPNICTLLTVLPFSPSHPKSEHASGQFLSAKLPLRLQ